MWRFLCFLFCFFVFVFSGSNFLQPAKKDIEKYVPTNQPHMEWLCTCKIKFVLLWPKHCDMCNLCLCQCSFPSVVVWYLSVAIFTSYNLRGASHIILKMIVFIFHNKADSKAKSRREGVVSSPPRIPHIRESHHIRVFDLSSNYLVDIKCLSKAEGRLLNRFVYVEKLDLSNNKLISFPSRLAQVSGRGH